MSNGNPAGNEPADTGSAVDPLSAAEARRALLEKAIQISQWFAFIGEDRAAEEIREAIARVESLFDRIGKPL